MRRITLFSNSAEHDISRNHPDYLVGSHLEDDSEFTQQRGQYYKIRPSHPTATGCKLDCFFHFADALSSAFCLFYFENWPYLIMAMFYISCAIASFFMQKRMSKLSLSKTEQIAKYLVIYQYGRTFLALTYLLIGGWLIICVIDHTWNTSMVPPTGFLSIIPPEKVGYHGWWVGVGLFLQGATMSLYWNSFRKEIKVLHKINQQKIFFQD